MVEAANQAVESAGVIGTLGLNGKLFLAQLVNFSVVLFVMWKWVYKPLVRMLDDRARKIEQGLKDAEASATAKESAQNEKDAVVLEARKQAKVILEQAAVDADRHRSEAVGRAKQEVERVVQQGREAMKAERAKLVADVKAEVADLVVLATERVLREKLDPKKDEKLVKESIKEATAGL